MSEFIAEVKTGEKGGMVNVKKSIGPYTVEGLESQKDRLQTQLKTQIDEIEEKLNAIASLEV